MPTVLEEVEVRQNNLILKSKIIRTSCSRRNGRGLPSTFIKIHFTFARKIAVRRDQLRSLKS